MTDEALRSTRSPRRGKETKPHVMIVEDEEAIALMLSYNLKAEDFIVTHASRGDEAEVMLAEQLPDLLILDWMLPGVSGLEICRRLRARDMPPPAWVPPRPFLDIGAAFDLRRRRRGVGAEF